MLMNLDTKEKVRHQLSHIRNSLLQNSLSAVYQNELEQIKGQGQKERNLAIEAMTWIYHAERPMKTMELLDILDFRFSNSYSASPSEPITISGVLNVCKGLLQAVLTTDTVSFVHFSVHEYLQGQTADHLILSEEIVAESCLNYLLHSISDNTNLNAAQFFSYAGNFWGSHYRHVGHETPLLLASCQRLLKDENAISVLYHFVSRRQDRESPTKDHPTEERSGKPSGLHLLSYFGLDWGLPIAKELDHSSDFLRDRFGKTPLHVAAEEGYPTCVQKLLDWDYSAVDADDFGRTPYHYAALGGHLKALKALGLMKSPTTLQPDNFGRTPLKYAIIAGRFGATCELLKISSHEGHLRDALQAALEGGDVKIVKVLLQSGAIPEYRHLLLAIKSGFEVAVKQLLEHGCTVNPPTDRCESALHAAVLARRNSILSFLVWNGANLEVEDEQGRKPLACAVERADYEAAQTLLQAGADPNVFIDTKSTIVHAASRGMSSIVELLLQAGSNMKDAALAATSHGQHEVLRLLLRSGLKVGPIAAADTEINGTSLLKEAVETGYKPVEALLRLSGAVGTTLAIDVHAPEKKQSSSNGNETSFVNDIIPLVTTKNYPDSQGIEFAKSPPSTLYRKVEEQRMDMPLPAERRLLAPIDSSDITGARAPSVLLRNPIPVGTLTLGSIVVNPLSPLDICFIAPTEVTKNQAMKTEKECQIHQSGRRNGSPSPSPSRSRLSSSSSKQSGEGCMPLTSPCVIRQRLRNHENVLTTVIERGHAEVIKLVEDRSKLYMVVGLLIASNLRAMNQSQASIKEAELPIGVSGGTGFPIDPVGPNLTPFSAVGKTPVSLRTDESMGIFAVQYRYIRTRQQLVSEIDSGKDFSFSLGGYYKAEEAAHQRLY